MALADQQLEREKLRLSAAKDEFDRALADTVDAKALHTAGAQARAAMLDGIRAMEHRLLSAIAGEADETRVHYLLSDAANDILREIGQTVEQATEALPPVGKGIARGAKPRDLLTVSQWADRHRWLESGTNAPGQWRTDRAPYLREIMDSLSEHSPVQQVTFIKSSGVGGTEILFNWLGYIMHHLENKDMLLIAPSLEIRDRSLNPRLQKAIRESPVLRDKVARGARNRANRADVLEYGARARIIKAGANSPDSLRSDHLPYVACDEVDAYPWDVGGEGDPLTLIDNRQRTFTRRKRYLISTPTNAEQSRIDQEYKKSDQRRYHVPCPHCGERHVLAWANFRYDTLIGETAEEEGRAKTVTRAYMICPGCGAIIQETDKPAMLAAGRWVPKRPSITLHRGYHINTLYTPVGLGYTWREIAQKWLDAQGDDSKLKSFVNTFLGEVWVEQGESIEEMAIMARLENYTAAELGIALITAGVDVQKDRLEATIVGWGHEEEAWLLHHEVLPGDPTDPTVWQELHDYLRAWDVDHAAIDEGYLTQMVREFVTPRAWCWPIKGMPGMNRPLIDDDRRRRQRLRTRRRKGPPTEPIGVDQGKTIIMQRLRLADPGPRFIHFPNDPAFDEEYFAQLAAEKLVQRRRGHRVHYEWVKTRARNEAWDCLIYAYAALRLSGKTLDKPRTPRLRGPETEQPAAVNTTTTKKQKPAPNRGVAKSDWSKRL